MSTPRRPKRETERRSVKGVLMILASLIVLASGCVDARSRPGLTDPGSTGDGGGDGSSAGRSDTSVELVSPDGSQQYFILGREMEIRVRASDAAVRIVSLGYEVRRSGFLRTIQEDAVSFSASRSAERAFHYVPPDTLPNPTLVLIRGYAEDLGHNRSVSDFVEVQLIHCPANATWC